MTARKDPRKLSLPLPAFAGSKPLLSGGFALPDGLPDGPPDLPDQDGVMADGDLAVLPLDPPDFSHLDLAAPLFVALSELLPGIIEHVLEEMVSIGGPVTPIKLLMVFNRHAPAFLAAITGVMDKKGKT